jgi:hypothetical protein
VTTSRARSCPVNFGFTKRQLSSIQVKIAIYILEEEKTVLFNNVRDTYLKSMYSITNNYFSCGDGGKSSAGLKLNLI